MGTRYSFSCARCGYGAVVSGGDDGGEIVATTTLACADCRRLYDVVISHISEPVEKTPRCPKRATHRVSRWQTGGPCPVCDGPLAKGSMVLLWD